MLTNLRDAFAGQSRSPNIVPFHMLGVVSYCAIVTLPLFDFKKCRDLENRVRGPSSHWKCHHVMSTYDFLSWVVSEIFNVEKYRDLEIGVRGHSMSLKVVPFVRLCMISY